MFHYKLTERQKRGDTKTSRNSYRQCLTPDDVGSIVGSMLGNRATTSVGVTKISQAAYIRATRSD